MVAPLWCSCQVAYRVWRTAGHSCRHVRGNQTSGDPSINGAISLSSSPHTPPTHTPSTPGFLKILTDKFMYAISDQGPIKNSDLGSNQNSQVWKLLTELAFTLIHLFLVNVSCDWQLEGENKKSIACKIPVSKFLQFRCVQILIFHTSCKHIHARVWSLCTNLST